MTDESLESEIQEAPNWPIRKADIGSKSLSQRIFHWGPLTALFIINFIGITSSYFSVQWLPLSTTLGFINLFVFLIWNFLTIGNLLAASSTGPGYVPFEWKPHEEKMREYLQECHPCRGYKAPRSHHCSNCNRCSMKMDHHCPWINNCVGHRNHSYFVRFLLSAIIGSLHALVICSYSFYYIIFAGWYMHYGNEDDPIIIVTPKSLIVLVIAFALAAGVAVALLVLLVIQVRYILRNKTGIEEYIDDKANDMRRRYQEWKEEEEKLRISNKEETSENTNTNVYNVLPWVYPYDLGWKRNLKEVLGNWRSGRTNGNGYWWPVKNGCDQFTFTREQLLQKKAKKSRARTLKIVKDFKASLCDIWSYGFKVFRTQPLIESTCLAVANGNVFITTRGTKEWLYGYKQENPNCKGWVPSDATNWKLLKQQELEEEENADE